MKMPCANQPEMMAVEDGAAPAAFLRRLFRELAVAGVDYAVMRNFDLLPDSVGSSDLDILIKLSHLRIAEDATRSALSAGGARVVARVKNRSVYLKTMGNEQGRWWGLAIDLVADVDYRGMVYITTQSILERSQEWRGVRVAGREDVALMALVKELINNLTTSRKYVCNARDAFTAYGPGCLRPLAAFGEPLRSQVVDFLRSDSMEESQLEALGWAMRSDLERQQGFRLHLHRLAELRGRLIRVFRRPGSMIVVTGTDGAGKSTLLNQIRPVLWRAFHKKVHEEHMRPNWIPDLGVAAGLRVARPNQRIENPHSAEPDNLPKSLFRLGYYWIDYTIGFFAKIYPLLVGRCHLVCFDRYFHDLIIDPRRMRIRLPAFFMKAAFALAPKPDLVICLGGDPQVIFNRKPETSLEEVTRQSAFLREFCAKNPKRTVWVDTTVGLNESTDTALRYIMFRLAERSE